MADFGTVQNVDLSDVWPHELDFSRWLAENIEVLDQQVVFDIDPKSVRQEVSAWSGTLRVDLLCDAIFPGSDEPLPVVIENQLYAADGDHLSGLIQYIVAFEAQGAVWIATEASAGYMRVVEWLNDETSITAYLFTMEVIRVDDSRPVPRLVRRVGPDPALTREGGGRSTSPERSQRYRDWWGRVLPVLARECAEFGIWKDDLRPRAEDMRTEFLRDDMPIGFYVRVMENDSRAGIWLSGSTDWRAHSEYYFDRLLEMKDDLEQSFGQALKWVQRGTQRYIYWDNSNSYGFAGNDPVRQTKEAEAIADAMKRLVTALNTVMSGIEPYEGS